MIRLAFALLLASNAASAQDCDAQPFPLSAPKPDTGLIRQGEPYPPEITRIRNGIVSASAAVPIGAGPLYQTWLAYDFDRAIFVSVDSYTYDGRRPRPAKPLKPNQQFRYVKDDQLSRAETVTVLPASAVQAREIACLANLTVFTLEHDNTPPLRELPPDHVTHSVHIIRNGERLRNNPPAIKRRKDQLSKLLQSALNISQP